MTTSVKMSDQACAMYIIVVRMQEAVAASRLIQFMVMGRHWSRLAKKKAVVHIIVKPIIIQEIMKKVLVRNILGRRRSMMSQILILF